MTTHEVDVVVVGLGPGGEALAATLARSGLSVVGVDRRLVGGECPYYGCIPSKMMIRAADALAEARRVDDLAGHAEVSPDWGTVADPDPRRGHRRLGRRGRGRAAGGRRGAVRPRPRPAGRRRAGCGSTTTSTSRRAAWSSTPAPSRACRRSTAWRTRRTGPTARSMRLTEAPDSLVVIGGGAIGLELAQAFAQVRRAGHGARGRRPDPRAGGARGVRGRARGLRARRDRRAHRGRRSSGCRTTAASTWSSTARTSTPTSCSWPPAAGPTSPTSASRPSGWTPTPASLEPDEQMRVGERLWAVGDITGKGAFTHVSMYQNAVAVRRPARPGRAVGRLPRRQPGDVHRPRGRRGRAHRAARPGTPGTTSATGTRSSRSRAAGGSTRRATRA